MISLLISWSNFFRLNNLFFKEHLFFISFSRLTGFYFQQVRYFSELVLFLLLLFFLFDLTFCIKLTDLNTVFFCIIDLNLLMISKNNLHYKYFSIYDSDIIILIEYQLITLIPVFLILFLSQDL